MGRTKRNEIVLGLLVSLAQLSQPPVSHLLVSPLVSPLAQIIRQQFSRLQRQVSSRPARRLPGTGSWRRSAAAAWLSSTVPSTCG